MRPEERDAAYLWDMLDAARRIQEFVAGTEASSYMKNRLLQLAVERCVEIIGEAARNVSESFRTAHPEIPWRTIIAQRNVLAHEYGDIRQDLMWRLATERVPQLIAQLEPSVPTPPEAEG